MSAAAPAFAEVLAEMAAMRRPATLPAGASALLLVDLQEEHRGDPRFLCAGYDAVLDNAARLLEAARTAGLPVVHSRFVADATAIAASGRLHPVTADGRSAFSDRDDPLTAICPEAAPAEGETVFDKNDASAFADGRLAAQFRRTGLSWLVVAGVWTEACIDLTVRDAVRQGFHVLLVKDACGSGTQAMHRTAILNLANRLYGGAVCDTAAACDLIGGETTDVWIQARPVPIRYGLAEVDALYDAL